MAVMARLLSSAKSSQSIAERAGHQKLVAQYIQKELFEADDANLLDEEDMHVFDLNPLTDPLHLVCCNFCRKPVKASEFSIHAELCRSLGIAEELFSELDSGTGNRKPQRKERKKSITVGKRVMSTGGQDIYANAGASENVSSCSQMDERVEFTSCLGEAKGDPGAIAGSSGEMVPLAKHPKLITADAAQPSDDIQTARGVSNITHIQDANTYICNVPAPLATKTYYSQRNNHLQAAISCMYHHASMKECCKNEREWKGSMFISEAPALEVFPERQFGDQIEKSGVHPSPIAQNASQIFRQGSTASLVEARGQASNNFVNQFSKIDAYTSQAAVTGATTSSYHPEACPLAGDSGTSLATIQRPTGSVPVV